MRRGEAVLYSYCISFFIRDVRGEFGLMSVRLFDLLPEVVCLENSDFFCLESGKVTLVFDPS